MAKEIQKKEVKRSVDQASDVIEYVYNPSNRLLEEVNGDTGTVYDYDLNGNVIGKSIANRNEKGSTDYTYSYSLSGLLTTVTKNGETVQENVYDAENIRSGRNTITEDGSAEEIFATLAGKLIAALRTENTNYPQEEWDEEPQKVSVKSLKSSNPYKRNFIYGNGLEKIGDFTAITNSHGDVKKLVGAKLETVAEYVYDAFGNLLNDQINGFETISYTTAGSDTGFFNDILYAGEQYDCVTETYYLRARMYSPSLGRFLEEDTYLGDGRNLYTYVSNNPVMFVDPSGYCKVKVRPRVISNGEYFDVALELDIDYVRIIDDVLTTAQNKISEVVPENILNTLSDIFNAASFFYEKVSEIHDNISGVTKIMLGLGILLEGSGMGPGSSSPALSLVGGETELAIVTDGALVLSGIAVLSGAEGLKGKEYKKISEAAKNVSDYLEKAAEKSNEKLAQNNKKINQMNEQIRKGKAPKGVERVDNGFGSFVKPHVHFGDDYCGLNIDGTWHDKGKKKPALTNAIKKWLLDNGWVLPND